MTTCFRFFIQVVEVEDEDQHTEAVDDPAEETLMNATKGKGNSRQRHKAAYTGGLVLEPKKGVNSLKSCSC